MAIQPLCSDEDLQFLFPGDKVFTRYGCTSNLGIVYTTGNYIEVVTYGEARHNETGVIISRSAKLEDLKVIAGSIQFPLEGEPIKKYDERAGLKYQDRLDLLRRK